MRRFIKTPLARTISRVLAVSMLLTCYQGFSTGRAQAQVELPSWAVVEFVNRSDYGGAATAAMATDSVRIELSKSQRYDVLPKNTVDQTLKDLGMAPPLDRLKYLKIGQELQCEAIVSGTVDQVLITKNPLKARVVMSVYVYDSASGRAIRGASGVIGESTGRVGMTGGEDALVQEAIQLAALEAVTTISSLKIPDATILFANPQKVLMNKGAREGIRPGMEMLVLRYGDYVATIKVIEVSADDAEAAVIESTKGVRPGDKARAIFPVEELKIVGTKVIRGAPKQKNLGNIFVTALVVGLVLALITGPGGGGSNTATNDLTTEAVFDPARGSGVKVSWNPNIFAIANYTRVEWHIWRSDVANAPIGVVLGTENFFIDDTTPLAFNWRQVELIGPGTDCIEDPGTEEGTEVALVPGRTYNYSLSLVYRVKSIDLPGGGGDDQADCFFESDPVNARGTATVLEQVGLEQPVNGSESVNLKTVRFSWRAVTGANHYVVQVSRDLTFPRGTAVRNVFFLPTTQQSGILSSDTLDIRGLFPGAKRLYWRVGARNLNDVPGPVPDKNGNRYVFSEPWEFTPVDEPPPPPSPGR
ncbi:MAG: hypothetical protein HRF45_11395 [Fimbriimonadia bacterium]